jgi:hypothetical protein
MRARDMGLSPGYRTFEADFSGKCVNQDVGHHFWFADYSEVGIAKQRSQTMKIFACKAWEDAQTRQARRTSGTLSSSKSRRAL